MRKIAGSLVIALLMLAAYSTSLVASGGKPPVTTPLALNGTYAVQWTLTPANGYSKLFQGTLKFDDSGIVVDSYNLFILEADGTSTTCSNSSMPYSPTGVGTLSGNAANFVVAPDITCSNGVTYRSWLVMTLAEGGQQFWLTGSNAGGTAVNHTLAGRGILQ
jgi:hypothetical protein